MVLEKKIPIDPKTQAFLQKMSEPTKKNLLSDYDRSVQKSFGKRKIKAKVVPQLGTQKKQTVDPMPSDRYKSEQGATAGKGPYRDRRTKTQVRTRRTTCQAKVVLQALYTDVSIP